MMGKSCQAHMESFWWISHLGVQEPMMVITRHTNWNYGGCVLQQTCAAVKQTTATPRYHTLLTPLGYSSPSAL